MENEIDSFNLPELAPLFNELRKGRHICSEDGKLFAALCQHYELFEKLFDSLGFKLIRHPRDFFYFESEFSFKEMPTKIAVFMFILIENLAKQSRTIEEALLSGWIAIEDLPHETTTRYKRYMDDAGATVDKCISTLSRLGFVEYQGGSKIRFKAPVCRFIDLCLIVLNQSNQSEDKEL